MPNTPGTESLLSPLSLIEEAVEGWGSRFDPSLQERAEAREALARLVAERDQLRRELDRYVAKHGPAPRIEVM